MTDKDLMFSYLFSFFVGERDVATVVVGSTVIFSKMSSRESAAYIYIYIYIYIHIYIHTHTFCVFNQFTNTLIPIYQIFHRFVKFLLNIHFSKWKTIFTNPISQLTLQCCAYSKVNEGRKVLGDRPPA